MRVNKVSAFVVSPKWVKSNERRREKERKSESDYNGQYLTPEPTMDGPHSRFSLGFSYEWVWAKSDVKWLRYRLSFSPRACGYYPQEICRKPQEISDEDHALWREFKGRSPWF